MTPRDQLVERLLALAWSQWNALGVAGASAPSAAAVDLEALLILTAELADADPRLRDEALDWCVCNSRFSSKPRLKQLLKLSTPGARARFSQFAATLAQHAGGSWPEAEEGQPLRVHLSGKSTAPDLENPALIRLKLRALLGVDARADLVASVLPFPTLKFSAAELVFVGYTKRNIADALELLVGAGLFRAARVRNRVVFSWRRHREFVALVKPLPPAMPEWSRNLRLVTALGDILSLGEKKSERVRVVEAAKMLRAVAPELAGFGLETPEPAVGNGTAWPTLVKWVNATAHQLTSDDGSAKFLVANE